MGYTRWHMLEMTESTGLVLVEIDFISDIAIWKH